MAVVYLGEAEAQADLLQGPRAGHACGASVDAARRCGGWRAPTSATPRPRSTACADEELLDRAARAKLLRVLVVIAGEGPKANGIPEMFYPSEYLNRDPVLRHVGALITDGRYSGATYGPCIGHASPEALEGGRHRRHAHRRPRLHGHARRGGSTCSIPARSWQADGRFEPVALDPAALRRAARAGGADGLAPRAPPATSRPPSA